MVPSTRQRAPSILAIVQYFEESPEGSIDIDDEPYTDDEQDHDAEPCWHDQVYAKQQEIAAWSRNLS